jgi:hypothetical protein
VATAERARGTDEGPAENADGVSAPVADEAAQAAQA